VVGHLQEVDPIAVGDARRQELRVDGLLDVAGQEQAAGAEVQVQDGRHVVDAGSGIGRLGGHDAPCRPADVHGRRIEAEAIAGDQPAPIDRQPIERVVEGGVTRAGATHPDFGHGPHPVALEEEREAGHVILVRMGQHDQVDPPVPGRQSRVQDDEQPIRVRSAIHEHAAPGVALDEDGVALTHVQDRHPQAPVGPGGCGKDAADDHERQGRQPEPLDPAAFDACC